MPLVRIDLIKGRSETEVAAIGEAVQRALAGVRPEDVAISIVESTRDDWSFGNGVAQYVVLPRDEWK